MNTTRRILAVLIVLAMLTALTACGTKQESPAAQIANPMKEVTAEEMVQTVGIPLYAPGCAENIRYFTITNGDSVIGQMDFTLDGKAYTYRTTSAQLDATELSGIHFTGATESYAEVSYAEGKFLTEGSTTVLFWEDKVPGVCYSLSCTECDNPIVLLEIAEDTFTPLQEAADGLGYAKMGTAYVYVHDPRENPSAMADIIENPDAVYGFSPNPESARLGAYADYDWTDPEVVEKGRQDRIAYHESLDSLYTMLYEMRDAGASIEEMARAVSAERNRLRLESYRDDPEGLAKVKKSNLETYGNENGPTADALFEKYGSWEIVIQKAFGTNAGMDACVGLYDDYYSLYVELGMVKA